MAPMKHDNTDNSADQAMVTGALVDHPSGNDPDNDASRYGRE